MACTWDLDASCLGESWTNLDEELQDRALKLATSSLQALTNNRVGTCPITIRPCPDVRRCHCAPPQALPTACSCAPLSEIKIPGPVGFIDSLRIDGVEVDLENGEWRLDNGTVLVWQGQGPSPIPASQDLSLPDTEPGTWSITYSRSYPVGEDGRIAVAHLAAEFAKACQPRGKCALPKGVTNVTRSGVSFTIEAGLFPNGLTGLELVDQFILKWYPEGSVARSASVFDPRGNQQPRVSSSVPRRSALGSL